MTIAGQLSALRMSTGDAAELFGITRQRLNQVAQEGKVPAPLGGYNLIEIAQAFVAHLRDGTPRPHWRRPAARVRAARSDRVS
jgi:hypothetical protein